MQTELVTKELPTLLFYLLAFVSVPLAFCVIFDRNIIRAGFLLIGVFGGISGLFLLLQAQFLAMAQIMIYAVGITLVVVIALMLTNPKLAKEKTISIDEHKFPAAAGATGVFITLYMAILSEGWGSGLGKTSAMTANDVTVQVGQSLLRDYSLPFEFASVLLLVALIGAVMLAKTDRVSETGELESDAQEGSERRKNDAVKV